MEAINSDMTMYVLLSIFIALLFVVTALVMMYYFRNKTFKFLLKNKELELTMQQRLVTSIIETQEQERFRIARDLHDDIASKMNAIIWNLHLMEKKIELNVLTTEELGSSLYACNSVQESIKQITNDLIPLQIENLGLHYVLEEMRMETKYMFQYENATQQETFSLFSLKEQTHLFRIIQELINNSLKHGKATMMKLNFSLDENNFQFSYIDNGIGCSTTQLENGQGLGIQNIILRSEILKGQHQFCLNNGFSFLLKIQNKHEFKSQN